jgi:hypothetical protein
MAPPSKETVVRVFFTEGVNIGPGIMVNSQDSKNDKVEMELHPAGVRILGRTFHAIVPYARIKSINLG